MKLIYSKVDPSVLLHIIHKASEFYTIAEGHRRDIVEPEQFIQLSSMNMNKGLTFKPHQHIWKKGEEMVIAQESWVVIKGSVECNFYDLVYEYKTGPYRGQTLDKIFIGGSDELG